MSLGLNIEDGVEVVETPFVRLITGFGVSGLDAEVGANLSFVALGGGDSVGVGYR